jgi:iron complex transport system ATP-binding protein
VQSLDPARQIEVMQLLKQQAESGQTVLVILHDLTLAARFCDNIWLMREGKLAATGATQDIMTRENLADVFNMDVELGNTASGAYIIPMRAMPPQAH